MVVMRQSNVKVAKKRVFHVGTANFTHDNVHLTAMLHGGTKRVRSAFLLYFITWCALCIAAVFVPPDIAEDRWHD